MGEPSQQKEELGGDASLPQFDMAAEQADLRSAARNAWFETSMEYDRSLLTLSAGAIGLLVTLASTVGVKSRPLFALALVAFGLCILSVLLVFNGNREYLGRIIMAGEKSRDQQLDRLDRMAAGAFLAGVVLSALLGMSQLQD